MAGRHKFHESANTFANKRGDCRQRSPDALRRARLNHPRRAHLDLIPSGQDGLHPRRADPVPSRRSKSALEHAPETGLEEHMTASFMAILLRG